MRVIYLITGLAYGGAETQVVHLATKLKARGWDVRCISITQPKAFIEELENSGIPVISLETTGKDPISLLKSYIAAVKILRLWRPHILHCHMVHANILGRTTRLLHRTPVIISTAHTINAGSKLREIIYRLTDPLSDITTIICQAAADRYIRIGAVPKRKLKVVPNGIDTNLFCPNLAIRRSLRQKLSFDSHFVWLAAGRFEEAKDYPNMLRAFAEINHQNPEAVLLIAGQGSLKPELEILTKQLGLNDRVYFLGLRRDLPDLMNAADAYVMSSAWEGMPMVLLEASATALPIVSTDVGGNREVVINGKSGFLIPPHNHEALAKAMQQIMALPVAERRWMGEAGREYVLERYELEHVIDTWENLYNELLSKKGLLSS